MLRKVFEAMGAAILIFAAMSYPAAAGFDGAYRGGIVCEKLKTAQFMLRAPFDLIITGASAVAARPIFNLKGTLVVGSEIATGTVTDERERGRALDSKSASLAGFSGVILSVNGLLAGPVF